MTDINDINDLMKLEDTIETVTGSLNEAIILENDLEIILIGHLKNCPEIKETLSLKNKMIQLRNCHNDGTVEKYVDDWLRASCEIQILKHTLRQLEGRRDSLKKKISIEPN